MERLSGVDQTTISAWLKQLKNPKFETVKRISDATGFCSEWLYLGRGPKRSEGDSSATLEWPLDVELLAKIIEQVESALMLGGPRLRVKPRDKARVVALAYEFYRKSGPAGVRRAKILELLERGNTS